MALWVAPLAFCALCLYAWRDVARDERRMERLREEGDRLWAREEAVLYSMTPDPAWLDDDPDLPEMDDGMAVTWIEILSLPTCAR